MPRHYETYDYYVVPKGGEDTNVRIAELLLAIGRDPEKDCVNLDLGEQHPTSSYHVPFETMLIIWFSMAQNQWLLVSCYRVSKKTGKKSSVPRKTFDEHKHNPRLQAMVNELRRRRTAALRQMAPTF